jgi:hypothetical protein
MLARALKSYIDVTLKSKRKSLIMMDDIETANDRAFLRYRAVSYIQLLIDDDSDLTEALTAAAKRKWPDCWGRQ